MAIKPIIVILIWIVTARTSELKSIIQSITKLTSIESQTFSKTQSEGRIANIRITITARKSEILQSRITINNPGNAIER